MDPSVSLVVELEDVSEREDGEIVECTEDENGLEDVSSSENEIILSDHPQSNPKRRRIGLNSKTIEIDTAQVQHKAQNGGLLSDISDVEPETHLCKKYIPTEKFVKNPFASFPIHRRQSLDKLVRLKPSHRTTRKREYVKSHRCSENRTSRTMPEKRHRHKHIRSKSNDKYNGYISSSDSESIDNIVTKRILKEALSIDSTNKTSLKNRLMNMMSKKIEKENQEFQGDDMSAPLVSDDVIVISELSSDEDTDLLRLRLLALKSKNVEKENDALDEKNQDVVIHDSPTGKGENEHTVNNNQPEPVEIVQTKEENSVSDNNESESEEVLQLRIQALRSAVIRKHLARKHKVVDDVQDKTSNLKNIVDLITTEDSETNSCGPSTENEILDNLANIPYSPTQSISDVVISEDMSDVMENKSVSDFPVGKFDVPGNSGIETLIYPGNVNVNTVDVAPSVGLPHMDSGQKSEEECTAKQTPPTLISEEHKKTVINTQKSVMRARKRSRTKSFKRITPGNSVISTSASDSKQTINITSINEISPANYELRDSDLAKDKVKAIDSSVEEDEGILREKLLANINQKRNSQEEDMKSLDDDEDILRAMLLSKLSNKMATTQATTAKNKENTLLLKNDKTPNRAQKNKFHKIALQKKISSKSPMKLVKKTVTNTKVINKRAVSSKTLLKTVSLTKENESNTKPKLPPIVVPKLIINLGAESDTDDENPFKSKTPDEDSVKKIASNEATTISPDFQKSLDVFLKNARSKVECNSTPKPVLKKMDTPIKKMVTPKIVRHMTSSQQREYKLLIQKMMILEKRKSLAAKKLSNSKNVVHTNKLIFTKSTPKSNPRKISRQLSTNRSKEDFMGNMKIEIKNDLHNDSRKVISAVEANVNYSSEVKNVCINKNCINVTIANNLAIAPTTSPNTVMSNCSLPPAVDCENNLEPPAQNKEQIKTTQLNNLDEKLRELQNQEKNLIQRRTDFISDIDDLLKMIIKADAEKMKEVVMENEVLDLRERLRQAEAKLDIQKKLTGKLFDTVAQSKKHLSLRKKQCVAINHLCMSLGSQISTSYRSPTDKIELMRERVEQLMQKTARYPKELGNNNRIGEQIVAAANKITDHTTGVNKMDKNMENKNTIESKNAITPKNNIPIKVIQPKIAAESKMVTESIIGTAAKMLTNVEKRIKLKHPVEPNIASAAKTNNSSDSTIPPDCFHGDGAQDQQIQISNEGDIFPSRENVNDRLVPVAAAEENQIKFKVADYVSPLANIRNERVCDPNAVLCPYELMGRCEDSHCKYKHLSVASDLQSH